MENIPNQLHIFRKNDLFVEKEGFYFRFFSVTYVFRKAKTELEIPFSKYSAFGCVPKS